MNALGITVVWCVIQVTLFALVATLVYFAARRQHDATAGARTALAGLLGVTLLTLLCWSPWPNWSGAAERWLAPAHTSAAQVTTPSPDTAAQVDTDAEAASAAGHVAAAPATLTWTDLVRFAWEELGQNRPTTATSAQPFTQWNWPSAIAAVFLAAAALGLLRLVAGLAGVAALRRRSAPLDDPLLAETLDVVRAELGCTLPIEVAECSRLATAATVGWRRPLVLLPTNWRGWKPAELRAVLAHEIAHVHRGDFATHALGQVGLALHYYHPLVHWLAGRLRLEQELAADAAAARVAGGQRLYLNSLAQLALAQSSARLAWPVQAFLPTRRTFLRRVEMLRDRKAVSKSTDKHGIRRLAGTCGTMIGLLVVGLLVAGLRAPQVAHAEDSPPAAAMDGASDDTPASGNTRYDFSYVPDDMLTLVAFRPAEIAADPKLRPLARLLEQAVRPSTPAELTQQFTFLFVAPETDARGRAEPRTGGEQVVVHTTQPFDFAARLKSHDYPSLATEMHEGRELYVIGPTQYTMSYYHADDTTLVGRARLGLLKFIRDENAAQPPSDSHAWQSEATGPLLVVMRSSPTLQSLVDSAVPMLSQLLAPMLTGNTVVVTIDPSDELRIRGRVICRSPEDAKRAAETLEAILILGRNALDAHRAQFVAPAGDEQAYQALFGLAHAGLTGKQVTIEGNDVRFETSLGKTEAAVKLVVDVLSPMVQAARQAAHRTQSVNHLKYIAVAMHNYHDVRGHLPSAVLYGPDGKHPYSWRVALLPFLEPQHQALYEQYRFDEPWDSPANRKVLEQMPEIYRHPKDDSHSTNASYFVLTGADTVFSGSEGTRFQDITDGTSKTLLAVEAKRDIPWTKPEDIPYAADQPLPELGGWHVVDNIFNAAMCDGRVHTITHQINDDYLRAIITRAGGEP